MFQFKSHPRYNFRDRLTFFLDNGYVHGLRYLGARCGFLGKVFWLIVMLISGWQMVNIFMLTFDTYANDAVSINIDAAYLNWNNTFPAVSVCMIKSVSTKKVQQFLNEYWSKNNVTMPEKNVTVFRMFQSYLFQSPNQQLDSYDLYCHDKNSTCDLNIDVLKQHFLFRNCNDVFHKITFLDKVYRCKDLFKLIPTEMGWCFIANSVHSHNLDPEQLPLKYGRERGKRALKFIYKNHDSLGYHLYVHSPEDLPSIESFNAVMLKKEQLATYSFNTIEITNQDNVKDLPIEKRKCRFPDEYITRSKQPYSFSGCILDLRVSVELQVCNCTIHTSPETFRDQYCDYMGMVCIRTAKSVQLSKQLHYEKETECQQSCIEMDLKLVSESITPTTDNSAISIEIMNVPIQRFLRTISKTDLDLVVTIGGIFGLFFGASILTAFQFFYIWIVRKF